MPHSDYSPQLATLVKDAPSGEGWLHEIKYDGYRIGCRIRGGRVTLISRNGKDWTAAFPEIVTAAAALPTTDALIDGEVAIVLPDGRTSFQMLQNASASARRVASRPDASSTASGPRTRTAMAGGTLIYFVFDLLRLDGESLARKPLLERKALLRALVGRRKTSRIRYADHVMGNGRAFFEQAQRLGLEGIISKRASEPYRPGRHGEWVKTKCVLEQEFVVGGFTEPEGARAGIGALLIGYYDSPSRQAARGRESSRLVFSGRVGTGFTHKGALELRRTLESIAQKSCPFDPPPEGALARSAHWVKPQLVCQVAFTEWTSDGKIRHPAFKGLRADKKAKDVRREGPPSAQRVHS